MEGTIVVSVYKKGKILTVVIIKEFHCCQLQNKILSNILISKLTSCVGVIIEGHKGGF
jgi:hypothetical protein